MDNSEYSNSKGVDRASSISAPSKVVEEIKKNHFELGSKWENNDYTSI